MLGSFAGLRIDGYERAMFADAFEGEAHRPFAYRALAPAAMRGVRALVPDAVEEGANRWFERRRRDDRLFAKLHRKLSPGTRFSDVAIALGVLYVCILGFAWALGRLARAVYTIDRDYLRAVALFAVAAIPMFFRYYSHLYDLPHLLLFTACLWLLAERRWAVYLPLFALTCASKETALLLVLVYALTAWRQLAPGRAWGLLAAQLGLFAAIKGALTLAFRGNPGDVVELHLEHNLFLPPFTVAEVVAFGVVATAIAWDWPGKPAFLRAALWILAPLLLLGILWGYLDEYRIYYEVYPVVLLLLAHSVAGLLRAGAAASRPPLLATREAG